MQPAILVRLSAAGPWRYGAEDGSPTRLDALFRSDRLFAALTQAAQQLGFVDAWLPAMATPSSQPAAAISSLFPFQGDTLFIVPPAALWPPPHSLVTSPNPVFLSKIRWTEAKFVPTVLTENILLGQKVLADQWTPEPESGCLLRRDRPSTLPLRPVSRTGAAVDRISGVSAQSHSFAGVEFEAGAGLWTVIRFANEETSAIWSERIKGLFRLLADTGFGGRRSSGWGQVAELRFEDGQWPGILFPKVARSLARAGASNETNSGSLFWLLSLFSPADSDAVDWSGGEYDFVERRTRHGKRLRFIAEGSVLSVESHPIGRAVNVASATASHPVYKSGIAMALELPAWPEASPDETAVVEPSPDLEPAPDPEPSPELEPATEEVDTATPLEEPEETKEPVPEEESNDAV